MESTWIHYKDKLQPNRKSGVKVLNYLENKYVLTEISDKNAAAAIINNVTMNKCFFEKLPHGIAPMLRAFFLENRGNGEVLYQDENKEPADILGGDITRIFVAIDVVTGFYMVEGSPMFWDELYAFRGLDEKDIDNMVCVCEYINALKRFNLMELD